MTASHRVSTEPTPPPTPLGRLLSPVRGPLAVAGVLQVVAALATVVPFVCISELALILMAGGPTDRAAVEAVVWIAVAAVLVRVGFGWLAAAITHQAAVQRTRALRREIADRIGRLPLGWLGSAGPVVLRRALIEELPVVRRTISDTVLDLTTLLVTAAAACGYLLWVDWRLGLISFLPLAAFVALYPRLTRTRVAAEREASVARTDLTGAVDHLVDELGQLRTPERVRRARATYDEASDELAAQVDTWNRPGGRLSGLAAGLLAGPLTLLLGLGIGTWFVAAGWMAPGDLVPFALLGAVLTVPLRGLDRHARQLRSAQRAARELTDLLDRPAPQAGGQVVEHVRLSSGDITGPSLAARNAAMHAVRYGARPTGATSGTGYSIDYGVEFSGVTLHDESGRPVVNEVDCVLRPHTLTALVGPAGSGKTALATLLARYAEPSRGAIRIGGVDIREIDAPHLTRVVGVVLTDPHLLPLSVADNIRLGRPDANRDEVVEAARAARVHDRIAELPQGYDTIIDSGIDGGTLTLSERLRLTIARQLITDPPVVILDEAIAYAEPEAEATTCDAIDALVAGRTTLVIAHRLSPVTGADQILVMNAGRIVERGKHTELLSRGGSYTALWASHERAIQRRYPSPVPGSRTPLPPVGVR